jgi:hypothetical protein
VSVYPEIEPGMTQSKKSYVYMVTRSALEATNARITHTGPLVAVLQAKFLDMANIEIFRVGNFTVLGYHGRNGNTIPATLPDGTLRPTENATAAQRRQADIMYAKIACDLRFTEADPENTMTHPFTFYARLPNETRTVTSLVGNELQLHTFHAQDDWDTNIQDQATMDTIMKSPQAFGSPFTLLSPPITDILSAAVVQSTDSDLRKIPLAAARPSVCRAIFKQLCPNLEGDPVSVIQNIHQVTKDEKGQEVHQSVAQYFTSLQNMANFLPKNEDWEIDITQHFWTHLTDNIRVQMQSNGFSHTSASTHRDPFSQLMDLQNAYAAATVAEDALNRYQRIAQDAFQSSLVLATGVEGGPGLAHQVPVN